MTEFVGRRRSMTALLPGLLMLTVCLGCAETPHDPRGQRVAAGGSILLNDVPLDGGRIVFEGDQGDGVVRATTMVLDGSFSFAPMSGPIVGDARVLIFPPEMELEELESVRDGDPRVIVNPYKLWIPPEYNTNSQLIADVTPDPRANQFDFRLTTE